MPWVVETTKIDLNGTFTWNVSFPNMDPKYLNCRSEFAIGDRVVVSYLGTSPTVQGTVSHLEFSPINRGNPHGDKTDYIYVTMDDTAIYNRWLSRGSAILVRRSGRNIEKCIIREIYREKEIVIKVAIDDGKYNLYPIEFVIKPEEIHAMLIWRVSYEIYLENSDKV